MKFLKKYLAIFFFLLLSEAGYSLTIYEISYEFSTITEFPKYTALLVRYGNGTGFMRVKYSNKLNTESYVVDMVFNEVEGRSKIDGLPHLTLQFRGENPKYIRNGSKQKKKLITPIFSGSKRKARIRILNPGELPP